MPNRHRTYKRAALRERSITALALFLLTGLFTAAGIILGYYFIGNPDLLWSANSQSAPPSATLKHLKLPDGDVLAPAYMLSNIERSALLRVRKIHLQIPLPYSRGRQPVNFELQPDMKSWMFATIEPASPDISSRAWLHDIYRIYIAGPAALHPSGLLLYKFRPGSPYDGMELLIDDLANPTVMIRCEVKTSTLAVRFCERRFPLTTRTHVFYRFALSQLTNWRQMHKTIKVVMREIFIKKR